MNFKKMVIVVAENRSFSMPASFNSCLLKLIAISAFLFRNMVHMTKNLLRQ